MRPTPRSRSRPGCAGGTVGRSARSAHRPRGARLIEAIRANDDLLGGVEDMLQ
jgi:hypothetical protein